MNSELCIVLAVLAGAAAYLAWRLKKFLTAKKTRCGCGDCGCPLKPQIKNFQGKNPQSKKPRPRSIAIDSNQPQSKVHLTAFLAGTLAAGILAAGTAHAAPYIEYLFPAGTAAPAGKSAPATATLEITLGGRSLDGAREVWVSGEGVTGEVLEVREPSAKQIAAAKERDEVPAQNARLRLTIAKGAAPGVRDLRIMARAGLSNRFRFEIGALPEFIENETLAPNDTLAAAPLVALPVVINGQILNADTDHFRFRARAGQRLLFRARARAIKPFLADAVPGWFQARLALFDAATGAKLAEVDDFRDDPDPVLLFRVPTDGEFIIKIWDALSRGRDDFVYRLTVGELPFVTDVFPLGTRANSTATLTLRGINLSAGNRSSQLLEVVTRNYRAGGAGTGEIAFNTPFGTTNNIRFEHSTLPEIFEKPQRNDTADTAQRVTAPCIVNGCIETAGDADFYAFEAKAGESFVLDINAHRLGSPLDSRLRLGPAKAFQNSPKKPAGEKKSAGEKKPPGEKQSAGGDAKKQPLLNDDFKDPRFDIETHHADSRLAFTAPVTGVYTVGIDDARRLGGPGFSYRLRIAPPQPDFEARVMPDNMTAPAGGNAIVRVNALRVDGFDGAVSLHLDGLPAGFKLGAAVVPAGKTSAIFSLAIPPDTKPGVYRPRYYAEAEVAGGAGTAGGGKNQRPQLVRHAAFATEEQMQAFFLTHTIPVAQSYLIVQPPAPFSIEIDWKTLRANAAAAARRAGTRNAERAGSTKRTAGNAQPARTAGSNAQSARSAASAKTAGDAEVLEIPFGEDIEIPVRLTWREIPKLPVAAGKPAPSKPATAGKPAGKKPAGKKPKPAKPQQPTTVRLNITRGAKGFEVVPGVVTPGATTGSITLRYDGSPRRAGEDGALVIEAVLNERGRRTTVNAPVLRYRLAVPPATTPRRK